MRWKKFAAERHAPFQPADALTFASYLDQLAKSTSSVAAAHTHRQTTVTLLRMRRGLMIYM